MSTRSRRAADLLLVAVWVNRRRVGWHSLKQSASPNSSCTCCKPPANPTARDDEGGGAAPPPPTGLPGPPTAVGVGGLSSATESSSTDATQLKSPPRTRRAPGWRRTPSARAERSGPVKMAARSAPTQGAYTLYRRYSLPPGSVSSAPAMRPSGHACTRSNAAAPTWGPTSTAAPREALVPAAHTECPRNGSPGPAPCATHPSATCCDGWCVSCRNRTSTRRPGSASPWKRARRLPPPRPLTLSVPKERWGGAACGWAAITRRPPPAGGRR